MVSLSDKVEHVVSPGPGVLIQVLQPQHALPLNVDNCPVGCRSNNCPLRIVVYRNVAHTQVKAQNQSKSSSHCAYGVHIKILAPLSATTVFTWMKIVVLLDFLRKDQCIESSFL